MKMTCDKVLNQRVNFIYNCIININEIGTSKWRQKYEHAMINDYIIESKSDEDQVVLQRNTS